jgi:uncharacterized protein (DUF433 family)
MAEIVKTEDVLGGKARIAGRRVSVFQLGEIYTRGDDSLERIADQLNLSLAEVHAALSYYYDHPDEMEAIRERRESLEAELRERSKAPEEIRR